MTYLARSAVDRPSVVAGRTVLTADSPVVWTTFPGAWHDVGRFHDPAGAFTGFYANVLTPVRIERGATDRWWTTDLFLDVFVTPDGDVHVLDSDEFRAAVRAAEVSPELARRAEEEAERLVREARAGRWPPAVVRRWTLDRARAAVG